MCISSAVAGNVDEIPRPTIPENAPYYSTLDEASTAAMGLLNGQKARVEYGGIIVKRPDGRYQVSPPVTSNDETRLRLRIPTDLRPQLAGTYHSHPEVAGADSHKLSKEDKSVIKQLGVPMFVLDKRSRNHLRGDPDQH